MGNVSITSELKIVTCSCGTVYCVPSWVFNYECPTCSARRRLELQNELDRSYEENKRLGRVISALRGAQTRKWGRKS